MVMFLYVALQITTSVLVRLPSARHEGGAQAPRFHTMIFYILPITLIVGAIGLILELRTGAYNPPHKDPQENKD